MDRSKVVAIITGVISLFLGIFYLVLVQMLDFRGEMQPAPVSQLPAAIYSNLPFSNQFPV
ncbi:glucose-inhibited division protein A [Leptolyngbya sp. 'hensonii']|nr:glucose-inhibited division protein A [Leptolyngbya sp. 'hensonii']